MGHTPRTNDFGIDLSIHDIARRGQRYCETGTVLDVQVKRTTRAGRDATSIRYDLERKAYDDLRDADVPNPRLLIVVVFARDPAAWLSQSEKELTIRGCGYWASLEGSEPTTRDRSVRIRIPRTQVFSVSGLQGIMHLLRTGGEV
jgi:hypothetical protein